MSLAHRGVSLHLIAHSTQPCDRVVVSENRSELVLDCVVLRQGGADGGASELVNVKWRVGEA